MGFDPYAVKAGPGPSVEELARQLDEVEHPLRVRFSMSPAELRRRLPRMIEACEVDETEDVQRWLALLTAMMECAELEARTRPPPATDEATQAEGPLDAALFFGQKYLRRM